MKRASCFRNPPFVSGKAITCLELASFVFRDLLEMIPDELRLDPVRKPTMFFLADAAEHGTHHRAESLRVQRIAVSVETHAVASTLADADHLTVVRPESLKRHNKRRSRHVIELVDEADEIARLLFADVRPDAVVQHLEVP